MSLKSKIQSLISAGNQTTGQENNNLTDVIQNLIEGYGTGSQTILGQKIITTNGTYSAIDDEYDGYSEVTVNVSQGGSDPTLITKSISANGTYNASSDSADGYSQVTVAVPASAVDSGTKNITANGNGQDVIGYAAVNVTVPNSYSASDEGKVVSNGALVAQSSDTVTANDTYDTTLINSLTVNVSGGGTLPRLLDHVEYTLVSDATQSNKQSIQLTAVNSNDFVLFLTPKTYPSAPASGYTALNWIRFVMGSSAADYKGSIIRADGTVGTDGGMASYNTSTGVLQIGGQYGTFRTGQVFDIYLFELA